MSLGVESGCMHKLLLRNPLLVLKILDFISDWIDDEASKNESNYKLGLYFEFNLCECNIPKRLP